MGELKAYPPQRNNQMGLLIRFPIRPRPPNPDPLTIKASSLRLAEMASGEIIRRLHPTVASEQGRRAVAAYVKKLIKGCSKVEVLQFGSVPLKTYLPDGDIDLTAVGVPNSIETLVKDIVSALQAEQLKKNAEFEVRDVHVIKAEVKIIKCFVQNIIVDISFDKIGGLCTLCFLEQVDLLIGKNNLFKRSIILIKAWCYYESRILGAPHSLLSTYGLETLVLYIFHMFHSSLDGPLAVLYRFLDYYSKFDWDKYILSLHGPIPLSSLPELVAEPPKIDGDDLLLSKDFLKYCMDMFSDPPRRLENSKSFSPKFLNIVDPLKENNNLGRSVARGNFYRIRSAFAYGARKLGHILLLPAESIADEINMFFTNTLERHGSGERPDVQDEVSTHSDSTAGNHNEVGSVSSEFTDDVTRENKQFSGKPATDSHGTLCENISNIDLSSLDKEHMVVSWLQNSTETYSNNSTGDKIVSGRHLAGEVGDLAIGRASGSINAKEAHKSLTFNDEMYASQTGKAYHASHLLLNPENGIVDGNSAMDSNPNQAISTYIHPDSSLAGTQGIGFKESSKMNLLADLNGDYDKLFKRLLYSRWCRENGASLSPQAPPFQYHNKYSRNTVQQHMCTHMNANGLVTGPPFSPTVRYPISPPLMNGAYRMENMPRPRGTGTYFPNVNYHAYIERQSPVKGRYSIPGYQHPRYRNNRWAETTTDLKHAEKASQDPPAELPASSANHRGKPVHASEGFPHTNGFPSFEGKVEFGTFGPVPLGASLPVGKESDSIGAQGQGSDSASPAATIQRSASSTFERPKQSYQLKNEADFPPLLG